MRWFKIRNLIGLALLLALWLQFTFVPTASAHNCLENIQGFLANPAYPPQGMIEDCMRTGYAQALITLITTLIAAGVISRELGQSLIDKTNADTEKQDCKARMRLVRSAAAEYKRYDQLISQTASEAGDIAKGINLINELRAQVDAAEQEYYRCAKWAAALWAIGAPIGWVGKRLSDWVRLTLPQVALGAKLRAAYLMEGAKTGAGTLQGIELANTATLLNTFANLSARFFAFAAISNVSYSEGERARTNLEAMQNEILSARQLLNQEMTKLSLKESSLRAKSDPLSIEDQRQRWHSVHDIWYKLLPDCTDQWSRMHGELGGEQLSNLPSVRGLPAGWQTLPLEQITGS